MQNMDIDDELNLDADHVPVPRDKRRLDADERVLESETDRRCTVAKCKSFGKLFSSVRNYNKHVRYTELT